MAQRLNWLNKDKFVESCYLQQLSFVKLVRSPKHKMQIASLINRYYANVNARILILTVGVISFDFTNLIKCRCRYNTTQKWKTTRQRLERVQSECQKCRLWTAVSTLLGIVSRVYICRRSPSQVETSLSTDVLFSSKPCPAAYYFRSRARRSFEKIERLWQTSRSKQLFEFLAFSLDSIMSLSR